MSARRTWSTSQAKRSRTGNSLLCSLYIGGSRFSPSTIWALFPTMKTTELCSSSQAATCGDTREDPEHRLVWTRRESKKTHFGLSVARGQSQLADARQERVEVDHRLHVSEGHREVEPFLRVPGDKFLHHLFWGDHYIQKTDAHTDKLATFIHNNKVWLLLVTRFLFSLPPRWPSSFTTLSLSMTRGASSCRKTNVTKITPDLRGSQRSFTFFNHTWESSLDELFITRFMKICKTTETVIFC